MAETLGQRLRALRIGLGLRMIDIASAAGISVSWVNDIEHDRNPPSLETLTRLARALETTAVEVLRGTSPYDE